MLSPAFSKNNVAICLSTDQRYVPYLCVTIQSIIEQASAEYNYDIVVLYQQLSGCVQETILSMENSNVSIRLVSVDKFMEQRFHDMFVTKAYYALPTYYRFFIPQIFGGYNKVLYLDCDLVALKDVQELFSIDLGESLIGAVRDLGVTQQINAIRGWKEYFVDELKICDLTGIFQAGVLVFNTEEMRNYNLLQRCIEVLEELPHPRVQDQCVLNAVCQGRVRYLDYRWNVMWNLPFLAENLQEELGHKLYGVYNSGCEAPFILHYASSIKPWREPQRELATYFWQIARRSPYYEAILYSDIIHFKRSLKERFFDLRLFHYWYKKLPDNIQEYLTKIKYFFLKG